MSLIGPYAWDWEVGAPKLRGWDGFGLLSAFEDSSFFDKGDPAVQVMCPVSGKRVSGYKDLKLRWDGVLVSKEEHDPRPRNYKRRPIQAERPRNLHAPGALTFLDDGEGRQ